MDNKEIDINKRIELHGLWLNLCEDGEKLVLIGADLQGINLSKADLREANLIRTELSDANLCGANLCRADLTGADLRRTKLQGTNLRGANLREADLTGADLREANLYGANLRRTNLTGADLKEANLCETLGNSKEIKTIQTNRYLINYTNQVMQIGCENHLIEDWFNFDDEVILRMEGEAALSWWKHWKPILKQIIDGGE